MDSTLLEAIMLRLDDSESNKETITELFLRTDYGIFETEESYIGLGPRGMDAASQIGYIC
jgi:hypothetical protein